jgi:uncharacterized protein
MPRRALALVCVLLLVPPLAPSLAPVARADAIDVGTPIVMRGAAVSETPRGYVGSLATFTITAARHGSGHVFLDTFPLTQVDMQGSARLAARVAAQASGNDLDAFDLFFVIRSGSEQIGGPSAGAALTVGAIAAMEQWHVRPDVLITGTIQPDGSIGPVGGIPEKAQAAAAAGIRTFLFPEDEATQPLSSQPGVTVDVAAYCREQLQMTCQPVGDVYEAVANMTDHAFVLPPLAGDVTGAAFHAKLGPLSQQLIDDASSLVDQATTEVAKVPAGNAARPSLDRELADARASLGSARNASANGTSYTAASLSFQASIAAHDARDAAKLALASDPAAEARALLADANATIAQARAAISARAVGDTSAFETAGSAQVRLMEAEDRLDSAAQLLANATYDQAVYQMSYAAERAVTATWWLRLGDNVAPGKPVQPDALDAAARDAITSSDETISYVDAVFASSAESRGVAAALDPARASLALAQRAHDRGFAAAALLDAVEAQVQAGDVLILASFGTVPQDRVEQARQEAARAIQDARGRGVEPLLAESEYEFGLSLNDSAQQLDFLGEARVDANLAGLPQLVGSPRTDVADRFQGLPPLLGVDPVWVVAGFAVGMALGVGLGLTAMMPGQRRRPPLVS